jgi:hypothetical protein
MLVFLPERVTTIFVCWGIEFVYLETLNPFSGFIEKVGLEVFLLFCLDFQSDTF